MHVFENESKNKNAENWESILFRLLVLDHLLNQNNLKLWGNGLIGDLMHLEFIIGGLFLPSIEYIEGSYSLTDICFWRKNN